MNRVSPKVLALLGTLTLVWGTNWPLFKIALDELPVLTFRAIVLVTASAGPAGDHAVAPRELRGAARQVAGAGRGLGDEPLHLEHRDVACRALHSVGPRLGAGLHHAALGGADRLRRVRPAPDRPPAGGNPDRRGGRGGADGAQLRKLRACAGRALLGPVRGLLLGGRHLHRQAHELAGHGPVAHLLAGRDHPAADPAGRPC